MNSELAAGAIICASAPITRKPPPAAPLKYALAPPNLLCAVLIFASPNAITAFSVNDSSVNTVESCGPFMCNASRHLVATPELLELLED